MSEKYLPFRWYGGKYSHLDFLLSNLPSNVTRFIEPFGGSGAVLVNREPVPDEHFGDMDEDLITFYRVLRDRPEELQRQISLTPFSREELAQAASDECEPESDMERARQFFVRVGQTRSGLGQTASAGRWAYCKSSSRRGMAGSISRFYGRLDDFDAISKRIQDVTFHATDAISLIEQHDAGDALMYCDPPYVHETRGDTSSYEFEFTDADHRELAATLQSCDGAVAVSGYQCDLYDELFGDWNRVDAEEKTMHTTKDTRQEALWVNYDPDTVNAIPGQHALTNF